MPGDHGHIPTLGQQPVGLAQLAQDLLGVRRFIVGSILPQQGEQTLTSIGPI
jgi:hypothetical protein